MTTHCRHSEDAAAVERFRYNPLELAFAPAQAEAVMNAVGDLAGTHTVGVVRQQNVSRTTHDGATVQLFNDRVRALHYPEVQDEYLSPQPLLDMDFVLIETDQDLGIPSVQTPTTPEQLLRQFRTRIAERPVFGLLLVGGFSTRMQRDKATLQYHGKTQAEFACDLLAPHCERVFISKRPNQTLNQELDNHPHIEDRFLGIGPMGGILSAQKAYPRAAWLVLACDLPFVDAPTIAHLLTARNPFKLATAYRSVRDGFPEPLCAVYEPKSIHRLLGFLARGYHCPRKVLINSDAHVIEAHNAQALNNINSPGEYDAALAQLHAKQTPAR